MERRDETREPGIGGRDSVIGLTEEPLPSASAVERVETSMDASDCTVETTVLTPDVASVECCRSWVVSGDGGFG